MSNDIIEAEATPSKALVPRVDLGVIQASQPQDVIAQATQAATVLADIIDKKKLYYMQGNKRFVYAEGWTTLAGMLGVAVKEKSVTRLDDGSYEAAVELIRIRDGVVIGGASALCGVDEKRWGKADAYARRSMAQTRATSKACRLNYSWIMTLAGYEATPAEEMPHETEQERQTALEKQLGESVMAAWRKRLIQQDATLGDVNLMLPEVAGIEPVALRNRVRQLIKDYTSGRGWTWDKERNLFQNEYGATGLEEPQQE